MELQAKNTRPVHGLDGETAYQPNGWSKPGTRSLKLAEACARRIGTQTQIQSLTVHRMAPNAIKSDGKSENDCKRIAPAMPSQTKNGAPSIPGWRETISDINLDHDFCEQANLDAEPISCHVRPQENTSRFFREIASVRLKQSLCRPHVSAIPSYST